MHSSKALLGSLFLMATSGYKTRFFPESGGLQESLFVSPVGMNYNLSDSLVLPKGSFWSSHFVHGNDDHEYLILSHVVNIDTMEYYRASILDITNPESYNQFTTVVNGSTNFRNGTFGYQTDDYFMGSVTADPLGATSTWSLVEGVIFNLTYEFSSPVLLNGGNGVIYWENAILVNEWSVPACKTIGTLNVNGTTVEVVSESSLTWYDRQWQEGSASEWTWFELHLDSAPGYTGEKISNWFYPSGFGTERGFATVRPEPGVNQVVAAHLIEGERTWTSPASNVTYHLDWTVEYADGTVLNISTIREDQELRDDNVTFITYEGYVDVVGERRNGDKITGYGLVEIFAPAPVHK